MARLFSVFLLFLLCISPSLAWGGEVKLGDSCTLAVPDWKMLNHADMNLAPEAVKKVIDCANEDPGEEKLLGWILGEGETFQAAFCLSLQKKGMGKLRSLIKSSQGPRRKQLSDNFIDTFASKLNEEYKTKRGMALLELSGDLMDADNDLILVMDGKLKDTNRQLIRGLVVFLHKDSLLNVSVIYDAAAPEEVVRRLDAIPISLSWN